MSDLHPLAFHLVGAPGSGKSAIAKEFVRRSESTLEEMGIVPILRDMVVDGSPENVESRGFAIGPEGSYYATMCIYHDRARAVGMNLIDGYSTICCGTVVDNLAHIQARGNRLQVVQTPENQAILMREMAAAQILSTYLADRVVPWNFIWYVPLGPQVVVPGRPESTFAGDIDATIRQLNVQIGLTLPVLDGTLDQKVDAMIESVKKNYTPPE